MLTLLARKKHAMHLFGQVLRTLWAWISGLFQQVNRYLAHGFIEIFTGVAVLIMVLPSILLTLLNPRLLIRWMGICLWALLPTIRFEAKPFTPVSFWGLGIAGLLLLALIPTALYLIRKGIIDSMMWSVDPNRLSLLQLQHERVHLAYLRVQALEENERLYYWRHRRFADPEEPLVISKYAGPMSFYYVTLSNYLSLPPESAIEQDSSGNPALPAPWREASRAPSNQNTGEQAQTHSPYAVLLLGGVRFRLRGTEVLEVPIKSQRVRETLAYLAVSDRERGCNRDEIVEAIHEKDEADSFKKGCDAYAYDVSVLRGLLKEACQQVQLPYVDPVKADRGNKAFHRLTKEYVVEDIARLERLAEDLAARRQYADQATDLETFRKEYTTVLSLYCDGFLGLQTRKDARRWVRAYFVRYQDLYHGLLWNLAEYEYAIGQSQQGEERKTSFRQAADLYERCAFLTAPSRDDLERGMYSPLSEQALRQCFRLYGLLGDQTNLHSAYDSYVKLLKSKSKKWRLDPQTVQTYEEAKRSSSGEAERRA
jgi:hypothetical protein